MRSIRVTELVSVLEVIQKPDETTQCHLQEKNGTNVGVSSILRVASFGGAEFASSYSTLDRHLLRTEEYTVN